MRPHCLHARVAGVAGAAFGLGCSSCHLPLIVFSTCSKVSVLLAPAVQKASFISCVRVSFRWVNARDDISHNGCTLSRAHLGLRLRQARAAGGTGFHFLLCLQVLAKVFTCDYRAVLGDPEGGLFPHQALCGMFFVRRTRLLKRIIITDVESCLFKAMECL